MNELRGMGLPAVWLEIARQIGVDAFLAMWRLLDRARPEWSDRLGVIEVQLRPYQSYLRFQRNRYIETLHEQGRTPAEIHEALQATLGEVVSARHISRIIGKRGSWRPR